MKKAESVVKIESAVEKRGARLCNLAHHLSLPLRQILLLCYQKLHEQLTVGC